MGYCGLSKFVGKQDYMSYTEHVLTVARGYGCPGSFTEGTVRLSDVCSGTESRIQDCGSGGIVPHTCRCAAHAWLICQPGELDNSTLLFMSPSKI